MEAKIKTPKIPRGWEGGGGGSKDMLSLSWVSESFRHDIGQFHSPRMKPCKSANLIISSLNFNLESLLLLLLLLLLLKIFLL